METHDQDEREPAPPSWVLRTPTRQREVWTLPALALVLAVGLIVFPVLFGDQLAAVVGIVTGGLVAVGAVALAVAGLRAYSEQSRAASWRLHVVRVVVGFGTATIITAGGLIAGASVGTAAGVLGVGTQVFRNARSVPRLDRLVAAVTAFVMAVTSVVLVLLGILLPAVPHHRASVWVGGGWVVAVVAAAIAVVQFRAASRAPRD
ncbi:hypothetical protein DEJ13_00675 [Curtobacterium sp. MCLR17_007]|uniref:hypothetical protein n=1 Tax=Curtobacterium sp. MCLR17_007 TaxID=2175648 RepID=UPI000DAACC8D|nr:hypothetical protein [Curtobacterium sp. MCLR17_007]WIB60372.1 hypothetical protein DEJ13_00675 [Curtobacterium sp. MCLR17_007]